MRAATPKQKPSQLFLLPTVALILGWALLLPNTTFASSAHLVEESPVEVILLDNGTILVDFGKVSFGNIELLPAPGKEGTVTVHFGEAFKDGRINRKPPGSVRYQAATVELGGEASIIVAPEADARNTILKRAPRATAILTPEEWGIILPFRWVEIEGWPAAFSRDSIVRRSAFSKNWDDFAADFTSSSDWLNRIWELCKYSIKATTFAGVYVDGDRERIPYEADAYLNQLSHYYVDHDKQVARDTFDHFFKHPTWPTEWASHIVFMLYADYMETGDTQWLSNNYERTKSKLLMERRGEDHLIHSVRGQGRPDLVDWPSGERDGFVFTERNTVINAFHLRSLEMMAFFAKELGKTAEADEYAALYASGREAFQAAFFDAQQGIYLDGVNTEHSSSHANFIPLAFGLVPEAHQKSVSDWVAARGMRCSVYAAQYLMEALFEYGKSQAAYDLMLADNDRSWKHMVKSGTTITWEAWDQKYKPNQDWNHAWGTAPANLIPRYILGVNALEPGFVKTRIRPYPVSRLEQAMGKVPTPIGPVEVKLRNQPEMPYVLSVNIPQGMIAQVEVPLPGGVGEIQHNGQLVNSVKANGFAVIEVGDGVHHFETTSLVQTPASKPAPTIIKATYGSLEKNVDVTEEMHKLSISKQGNVSIPGGYNRHVGDPHLRSEKVLIVEYELGGELKQRTFSEDAQVLLN